jgi:hypothetical protein
MQYNHEGTRINTNENAPMEHSARRSRSSPNGKRPADAQNFAGVQIYSRQFVSIRGFLLHRYGFG